LFDQFSDVPFKLRDGPTTLTRDARRKICKSGSNDVDDGGREPAGTQRREARTAPTPISELALIIGGGVAQLRRRRRHNGAASSGGGSDGPNHSRVVAAHNDRHDVDTGTVSAAAAAAADDELSLLTRRVRYHVVITTVDGRRLHLVLLRERMK